MSSFAARFEDTLLHDLQRPWTPQRYCSLKSFILWLTKGSLCYFECLWRKIGTELKGCDSKREDEIPWSNSLRWENQEKDTHTFLHTYTPIYTYLHKCNLLYSSLVCSAYFPQALLPCIKNKIPGLLRTLSLKCFPRHRLYLVCMK